MLTKMINKRLRKDGSLFINSYQGEIGSQKSYKMTLDMKNALSDTISKLDQIIKSFEVKDT